MANLNLNKIILGGRLTKDPELRRTQTDKNVCSFTIAVNKKGRDAGAEFIDCVAWNANAENISKYFHKGSSIAVCGSLGSRKWKDKQGADRVAWEVTVDEFYFVDGKNEPSGTPHSSADAATFPQGEGFEELSGDDDLPF